MEEFDKIVEAIKGDNIDAAKELHAKHFMLAKDSYSKFDNLAKELGFEKPEGVSTIDHYTQNIQNLRSKVGEFEKERQTFAKKLEAYSGKDEQWQELENKYKGEIEAAKTDAEKQILGFAENNVKTIANSFKFSDKYTSEEAKDLTDLALSKIKAQYEPRLVDGQFVPYTNGERAIVDGSAVTYQDLLKSHLGKYTAQETPPPPPNQKPTGENQAGSATEAAKAAGLKVGSAEFYAFVRNHKRK